MRDRLFSDPRFLKSFRNLQDAMNFQHQGLFDDAEKAFARTVKENPKYFDALHLYGLFKYQRGQFNEALMFIAKAGEINPRSANALNSLGVILARLGRQVEALANFDAALKIEPNHLQALSNRCNVVNELGRFDDTIRVSDHVLRIDPNHSEAYIVRGAALVQRHRYMEALESYDQALKLRPNLVMAFVGRGNVFCRLKRYEEAFGAYENALALQPDLEEVWIGRGNIFCDLRRFDDALAAFDKALALKPGSPNAWIGRANMFCDLQRYDAALSAYDMALKIKPHLAAAWLGRGHVLFHRKRYNDALAAYDQTLALDPKLADAWHARGIVFVELKQFARAFASFDKAIALTPTLDCSASLRLFAKLHLCDWTNLQAEVAQVLSMTRARDALSWPFTLLPLPSSPADQLTCARSLVEARPNFLPLWRGEVYTHDRIRVAYVSSELREHAVAYLTAGLFEYHDRSRFEVTAISFESGTDTEFCRRIAGAFERFVDASTQNDSEIADLIRKLEIDIVIDLNGFTRNARLGLFAQRPAPIQVNYLGYAGTMGANYYDYIIGDRTVIPPEHFDFYSERIVWLPGSFLVNDARRPIAARVPPRSELGLPEEAFVFCCFNQSYKIGPGIFDIWMRLLQDVDGSVLWLKGNDAVAVRNLRIEAEHRGVAPNRLVFAPPVALVSEHLARQSHADLFLDTEYYNAHTTACDALWAGLPVLTCRGSTFAGRVGASLLQAVGLSELVVDSLEDYEVLALALARDRARLAATKAKLVQNRNTASLFDTARSTRNIEAAYMTMWQAYQDHRPPVSFAVS